MSDFFHIIHNIFKVHPTFSMYQHFIPFLLSSNISFYEFVTFYLSISVSWHLEYSTSWLFWKILCNNGMTSLSDVQQHFKYYFSSFASASITGKTNKTLPHLVSMWVLSHGQKLSTQPQKHWKHIPSNWKIQKKWIDF